MKKKLEEQEEKFLNILSELEKHKVKSRICKCLKWNYQIGSPEKIPPIKEELKQTNASQSTKIT